MRTLNLLGKVAPISKLEGVAPLITYPTPAYSPTTHSRLASLFTKTEMITLSVYPFCWSGIAAVAFEPMVQFSSASGFRIS